MSASGAFRRFLNSETGPKTVHFWAPTLKWSLVFAGLSDLRRPVDKVSGAQNLSLLATGVIWTRWSFVIRPKNLLLASVNFFLGCTAGYQLARISRYRVAQGDSFTEVIHYLINGPEKLTQEEEEEEKIHKVQSTNVGHGSLGQSSTA